MDTQPWRPLQFEPRTAVIRGRARQIALVLMNYYTDRPTMSRTRWEAQQHPLVTSWDSKRRMPDGSTASERKSSKPFRIYDLDRLLEEGTFKHDALDLPPPECPWLDREFLVAWDSHIVDDDKSEAAKAIVTPLVQKIPLRPNMDREGVATNGFQLQLMTQVRDDFQKVVDFSSDFGGAVWFWTLRQLICDTVALVDIFLTAVYLRVQFDPEPGWRFEPRKLGQRHSRRLADKIRWISQITGSSENRPRDEYSGLMRIKGVRNHLQHFDPPLFAYTMEDVQGWLQDIQGVFRLLLWLRRQVKAVPPVKLIELLLLPPVTFHPKYPHRRRVTQAPDSGYASVCWPHSETVAPDVHSCRCEPPRLLAIPPSVAEGGPIICGRCKKVFKPYPF